MFGGLFGGKPTIKITINGNPEMNAYRDKYTKSQLPAFGVGDKVTGNLSVEPVPGKSLSHKGIELTLCGAYREKDGTILSKFLERKQMLAPAGELTTTINTDFTFDKLSFQAGSYYGQVFDVIYYVELKIIQTFKDIIEAAHFLVFLFSDPETNEPIHNEVGMSNVLHVEFVFPQAKFDCTDVVIGAAYFILVKLRIVHMQVALYCNETYDRGGHELRKKTILSTAEILDGPPVRGDYVPIRFFLGSQDIWPFRNFKGSHGMAELYLRVQMTDENGKKYFKRLKVDIARFKKD